ncbi:MAG: hypothetical protein QOE70_2446 [Chthoniobacter sp.]|jgi:cytochrome b561|nr:hypothetical protein [Chthoniobacter sp.]
MQRSTFHLNRPFQALVYATFGALLITGAGWMFAPTPLEGQGWEQLRPLLLKIHGGAAMAALLVLGALVTHIRRGWSADKNRLSGALMIALNAFLIATGYGLYYAGEEGLRAWLSRWHAWIGLGVFILLPTHVIAGRIIIRRLHAQKAAAPKQTRAEGQRPR